MDHYNSRGRGGYGGRGRGGGFSKPSYNFDGPISTFDDKDHVYTRISKNFYKVSTSLDRISCNQNSDFNFAGCFWCNPQRNMMLILFL